MKFNIRIWITERYRRIVESIAFFPAFIALLFVVLSWLLIKFDFSDQGKHIKSTVKWLGLADASTARSIISAIAAGIISLTVFSFSMVMIVLNQAAAQMSNRVLDKLIGNRFQQLILGIYIGTIVYALFLLSTIRDIDSGVQIPALSIYLLIVLTVVDIFLFIYFLHYITQSIKYEVIIERIRTQTFSAMKSTCRLKYTESIPADTDFEFSVLSKKSGIYVSFDQKIMLKLCKQYDCMVKMIHPPGTFVLKGFPLLKLNKDLSDDKKEKLLAIVVLPKAESVNENYLYGIRQLMEVAIKALSPGINDPGTAVVSLRALFQLFSYCCCHFPKQTISQENGIPAIIIKHPSFEEIMEDYLLPIWEYGRNDRLFSAEFKQLLLQFQQLTSNSIVSKLLIEVEKHGSL